MGSNFFQQATIHIVLQIITPCSLYVCTNPLEKYAASIFGAELPT
jgi:hypothetical protein